MGLESGSTRTRFSAGSGIRTRLGTRGAAKSVAAHRCVYHRHRPRRPGHGFGRNLMAAVISYDSLRRIPLLHNLNESEVHQIADVVRLRTFAPGEYVIRQGDHSRDLWIVLEGECEVVRRLKPDEHDNHQ